MGWQFIDCRCLAPAIFDGIANAEYLAAHDGVEFVDELRARAMD
ncbi:hypothetical protein [Caballeronia sp. LZ035]|nr:hypothetical protein [Caballeronia sp. LZ035]MDR5756323.1 hypothetical protein [Caballeronia sp. LZ035]